MIEEFTKEKVLDEVAKLQYLYRLKREIRYDKVRKEEISTESVAEHVYGMHILAMYFLPLEDPEEKMDRLKIFEFINIHDLDEVETGDVIGWRKTEEQKASEVEAMKVVIKNLPEVMRQHVAELDNEYATLSSPEAKFVKALDRFEPLIQVYNEDGKKTMHSNHTTAELSMNHKVKYVASYPYIKRFTEVLQEQMVEEGYFWKE